MTVRDPLPAALLRELEASGYFPETAAHSVARGTRGAAISAYLVRPETTFDGAEVRRHLTVLALTSRHLIVTHLDDDPANELNPSQVIASTERIRLERIISTGLSQVFNVEGPVSPGAESEVSLGITWGGTSRVDVERAVCDDPSCQYDHGSTGTIAPADVALRVSALADGPAAVVAALDFHDALSDAIDDILA